ncbi:hypothetical protein KUV57_11375 [Epibacterium sp. DP7N7-1]|nr:hypothetical protein [Epibacterium sp. DP7N7-1]
MAKKKKQPAPRPWRHLIPEGWHFRMSYDHRGDGCALFTVPLTEVVTRTYRIRAGWNVGWNSKVEAFGEAALRRLFELHPELRSEARIKPAEAAC